MHTSFRSFAAAGLIVGLGVCAPSLAASIQMVASGTVDTSTYAGAPVGTAWTFTLVFDPTNRGPNVFAPPSPNNATYQLFGTTATLALPSGTSADIVITPTRGTAIREYPAGSEGQDAVIFNSDPVAGKVSFFLEGRRTPDARNSLLPFTTAAEYQAFFDSAVFELANFCFQNCTNSETVVRFLSRSVDWKFTDLSPPQPPGVPEPGTAGLLGLGIAGLVAGRRRSRR